MKHVLVVGSLVTIASLAGAADWRHAASTKTDTGSSAVAINMESIRLRDDLRQAWVRTSYDPKQRRQVGSNKTVLAGSSLSLQHFDCKNSETSFSNITYYSEMAGEGTVLHTFNLSRAEMRSNLSPAIPDSVGEALLKVVCEHPI